MAKYKVKKVIFEQGRFYKEGDIIELDEKRAKALGSAVSPLKEKKSKKSSKK